MKRLQLKYLISLLFYLSIFFLSKQIIYAAENIPTSAEGCLCARAGDPTVTNFHGLNGGRAGVLGCKDITYNNSNQSCKTGEICLDNDSTGPNKDKNLCQPDPNAKTLISKSCSCLHSGDSGNGQNGFTCDLVWLRKDGVKISETQNEGNIPGNGYCGPGTQCENNAKNTVLVTNDPSCKSPTCTSQTIAVCKPVVACQCTNEGITGSGNNTKNCGLPACANTEYCQNGTNTAPTCHAATCTCEHTGLAGAGNNWFDCYDKGKDASSANQSLVKHHESCSGADACVQKGANISCVGQPQLTPPQFAPFDWCGKTQDKNGSFTCNTALGAILTSPAGFISSLFKLILGIAGMVAVGVIVYSGLLLLTSQGNQEKMQGAKETITAAIVGIIFIIFSMVILQTIGVDILGLPGIGK